MKKLLATLLLLAAPALAQLNSDQIKLKTNGGLTGDTAKALAVAPYRGTSAPSSPVTGQLWMDTTYDPPTLKTYNGSTWVAAQTNNAMPMQGDADTFPVGPVDGQLFWSRSNSTAYIYDSTSGIWRRLSDGRIASGTYRLPTSATVITAPSAAPTLTFASGGSATSGAHECVYTYVNSTGGETSPSPASTPATAGTPNFTYSLTGVTTGGTGTVARRVYCSKAGTPGAWYWVAQISDNSTTTVTATTADASNVLYAPSFNYSGPLPSGWTCSNCTGDSGGCGCASNGAIGCKSLRSQTYTATAENHPRASYSLSGVSGSFAAEARVVGGGLTVAYNPNVSPFPFGVIGVRAGTAANSDPFYNETIGNSYFDSTAPARTGYQYRTTAGASMNNYAGGWYIFPQANAYPLWMRVFVDEHTGGHWVNGAASVDREIWTVANPSTSWPSTAYYALGSPVVAFEVGPTIQGTNQAEVRVDSVRIWTTGW